MAAPQHQSAAPDPWSVVSQTPMAAATPAKNNDPWSVVSVVSTHGATGDFDDLSDNPNHEGMYQIEDDRGNVHAVPFSKAKEAASRPGWGFSEDEGIRFNKDSQGGYWAHARAFVNRHTEPVPITPGRSGWERPASNKEAAGDVGRFGEDVLKRTGRVLFGIPDMVPQYYSAVKKMLSDDEATSEEGEKEVWDFHPGSQIVNRIREFRSDWKKDPNLAVANSAGDALGMYIGGKATEKAVSGAASVASSVKDAPVNALRKIYGTSPKATERYVAEVANKNDKLLLEAKTEGEKAHAAEVQRVRDSNDEAVKQHQKDVAERNELETRRVKASRKLAEQKARLANHIRDIHDSAVAWFDKQYDSLGELTKNVRVPFAPLVEAVEKAKLENIAGSDTKVGVFEDVLKRARGEMQEPEAPPAGWEEATPEEREEWTQRNLDKTGISYKDLTGYYRELGKILKSPGLAADIREGAIQVRSTIEEMQRQAARLADERATQIARDTHTAKPPSAAQLNYSIGEKYKNFAESYRDSASAGHKSVNAENAHEATKPYLKDMTDEELAEVKRRARGLEREGGKKTNATEWAGRNSADDTLGKGVTRAQRRAQTEKLIDQARSAKADLESLPEPSSPPELKLEPEPEYVPPKEQTITPEQLRLEKTDWMNRRIAAIQSNGMKIGVRSIGTIGLAEILSHIGGFGSAGTEALAGGLAAATFFAPEILDKILKMPGVREKLLAITPEDEAALAKLPANQRAGVEQGIVNLTQLAKMRGKIKPDTPTPLANYAKADLKKSAVAPATSEVDKTVVSAEPARGVQEVKLPVTEDPKPAGAAPPEPPAAPAPEPPPQATPPPAPAPVPAPAPAAPEVPSGPPLRRLEDLHVDPQRFQYKLGGNKHGVTDPMDVEWDQSLADPIHTWVDPEDGKEYVVNGHHRFDLAKKAGAEHIQVNPLDNTVIKTAQEARQFGALKNLADGNGTSVDAAKFFRDSGLTSADLKKYHVSLKKSVVNEGMGLSRLKSNEMFNAVIDGRLDPKIGSAIGEASDSEADQESILKDVRRQEKSGVKVTADQIRESARLIRQAPSFKESTQDLFGEHNEERSLFMEMGEVSDYIRKQLAAEKRTFGSVADKGKAETLAKGGNVISPEKNAEIAQRAAQQRELYDKRSAQAGPVHAALAEAAEKLAEGGDANAIKRAAYEEVREHLAEELGETH